MKVQELALDAKTIATAINERDWAGITARCAFQLDFLDVPTAQRTTDVQGLVDFFVSWTKIFPDLNATVEGNFSSPEAIVIEIAFEGTQTGPFPVADGTIPPTKRNAKWRSCFIFQRSNTGPDKFESLRVYYDFVTILDQMAEPPASN